MPSGTPSANKHFHEKPPFGRRAAFCLHPAGKPGIMEMTGRRESHAAHATGGPLAEHRREARRLIRKAGRAHDRRSAAALSARLRGLVAAALSGRRGTGHGLLHRCAGAGGRARKTHPAGHDDLSLPCIGRAEHRDGDAVQRPVHRGAGAPRRGAAAVRRGGGRRAAIYHDRAAHRERGRRAADPRDLSAHGRAVRPDDRGERAHRAGHDDAGGMAGRSAGRAARAAGAAGYPDRAARHPLPARPRCAGEGAHAPML